MKQQIISEKLFKIKAPNSMVPIGICIHNTANDASAAMEIKYMASNTKATSYHIAVDDKEAIQAIPFNRNTWHAGDGRNGLGNRQYIGIEICYSKSGGVKFVEAEKNAVKVVADLLEKFNWTIDNVKKHQDFNGKYCPHRTLDMGWDRFLKMIEDEVKTRSVPKKPRYIEILEQKVDSPHIWVGFIEEMKNHPTGKYLPQLIEKVGGRDA